MSDNIIQLNKEKSKPKPDSQTGICNCNPQVMSSDQVKNKSEDINDSNLGLIYDL